MVEMCYCIYVFLQQLCYFCSFATVLCDNILSMQIELDFFD